MNTSNEYYRICKKINNCCDKIGTTSNYSERCKNMSKINMEYKKYYELIYTFDEYYNKMRGREGKTSRRNI